MQRRQALQSLGALMLGGRAALAAPTSGQRRPRILFFSRSVLFEHSVVRREGQSLSLAEKLFSRNGRPAPVSTLSAPRTARCSTATWTGTRPSCPTPAGNRPT